MDEFLTDEQQADRARSWLQVNGVFIAAGVVLGLGGLFGWQQWQAYQQRVSGEASVVWEQLRRAVDGNRLEEANESLAVLEKDYARTPYLDQARLQLAQMHMNRNAPDAALEQLNQVAEHGRDPQLRRIARLRQAQVLSYQGEYEQALTVLGNNADKAYAGLYHDLRGDILFAQGNIEAAATEYELALTADTDGALDRAYVQIKLDDVRSSMAQSDTTEAASIPADDTASQAAAGGDSTATAED